ncbi:EF-hand calcium-binding domain-containing protein 6 [Hippopotamus amphibius kiboko]|uniref:EF-hand calcium-binding domain-containing protein 6 n=1 Tax=Hippopotamus amphibius kiboko TaxID=575201 RepID=UPI00259182CC|nr:EF-hand calcium-binding domain-containing protein 6 [Hippopotamus amphibius kiboko]
MSVWHLTCKMAVVPDWHTLYPHTRKFARLRPHSSPCRVYSRNGFQNMFRPSSSTAIANPILSSLDIKRILFQKITEKGDELKKAFHLLDTSNNMTVTKNELRRVVTTFLLPLTREQFQDVLAQIPLTSAGAVPYLVFLSRFGGIDLNINVIKRGGEDEMNCCRTLNELEVQVGEKIFKNIKTVIKALKLIDVNKTGLVQPHELRRVLETFCLKMRSDEYKKFAKHYKIDKDTAVDYNVFLKNLSTNNELNLKYPMGSQEVPWEDRVKSSRRESLPSSVSSEDIWKNCSLDEIERTFCQELSKSYEKVEKALSAGDPSKCGYVSLNYLKIVLDTFVYRLPRRIFIPLMKRFGLKTTTKVNWKQFLTSFYEPQWLEASHKIPLTKRTSVNSRNQFCKENIITKLFRCEDHHTSLKKALLIINSKPDGQITGEELRRILNCMVVKISDSEFKELMQTLDPGCTGWVNISTFIELLREDPKLSKISSYKDTKAPLFLAWDSVEEIVRDTLTKNLQAFCNMLRSHDLGDSGLVGRNSFKRVMHVFCPFLTAAHLVKLCSKFQDIASGRILYKKLLACLGLNGPPTVSPVPVPKDQLLDEHLQKEEPQRPDLPERAKPTESRNAMTKNMTKDEVIEKLKNCIRQQDPAFRKRFLDFSKEPNGKINVRDFKKVLEDNGMPMGDHQFALLTAKLGYKKEGMSYLDFATGFEDPKMNGPEVTPPQTPALSKGNLDSYFLTAEECLRHFPRRLKESFRDPYAAFFKMDTDRDGILTMRDLHRLLQHLLFNLKDEEFERFLGFLGLRLSVTLNFREFRNLCEKRPFRIDDDVPQRLVRPKQKVTDSELACEQAHQYLVTKAKTRWSDLSKNFIETDSEGNGILRRRDVKNALYGFDIPLTPREFEKLWMRYDTEGRGHITYQEFLQKLGINYSADIHRPHAEDYFNFMGHFTKPQQVQEEVKELQQSTEKAVPARDKLKEHYQDISKALAKLDKSRNGCISLCKMQKSLQECGCSLTEEELTHLLNSWGISWRENSISYLDFLRAVEKSKPARPPPQEKEESVPINFALLGPEEVLKNIQEVVTSSSPALWTAFSALDKDDTGFVKAPDFGQVLKDFCYKLTDNQYHYFLRKLRIHLTPHINWKYFLQNFNSYLEETAAEWAEKMPKGPLPMSPKETANQELLARLHKAVTTHYHTIAQEFENFDTMKTNTASRDEFRSICTRHVQVLTDEQFDRLWEEMPVNAKGRLRYLDFLSSFSSEKAATLPATGDSAKAQRGSSVPEVSERSRSAGSSPTRDMKAGSKPRSHPCTPASMTPPLQNCEPIENKLRKKIQGCWREFLRECKERDANRQGEIPAADFLALVEKFNLDISRDECQQLIVKYDLKNNGKFTYCNFIQSCVLLLKAKETSLMQRMKIQNANKMKEVGAETSSFYSALLRIQPQIVHCWRPMRRTFKAYDAGGTGLLSVADFRMVLRQYSINLSEEEFFHILEYYDKTLSSKISYNDFLRVFLQ